MAANQTVAQLRQERNYVCNPSELTPRHGVISLSGYGIGVRVDRGHLVLEDGVGTERRRGCFSRVDHGLQRLAIIGAHGHVSLSALRWLVDQKVSFTMLDRDGSVLATTGPVGASDGALRRARRWHYKAEPHCVSAAN